MTELTRRLRYQVAMSLDGYIANENGSYDWIIDDPTIDFGALFAEFDTLIMGRRTFEIVEAAKNPAEGEHADITEAGVYGKEAYVFSRTLHDRGHARIHVVRGDVASVIAALKTKPGRDVWLFGGGDLARQCFDAGLVDTVEVAVMPVLIGAGIPVLPRGARVNLSLQKQHVYASGIVMLEYMVRRQVPQIGGENGHAGSADG